MIRGLILALAIGGLAVAGALLSAVAYDMVTIRRRTTHTLETIRAGRRSPSPSTEFTSPLLQRVGPAVVRRVARLGLRLLPEDQPVLLQRRITAAGSPKGWSVDRVVAAKFLGLGVGWLLGLMVALLLTSRPPLALAISLLVAMAAYLLPDVILYQLTYNRAERIRADLPDMLDLLTISVEAGQPFETALRQVADSSSGPLRLELGRLIHETDLGMGRTAALRAFGERARVPEARSLAIALAQADTLGVPIANVLRSQASQLRQARSQRIEEQAQKMPVKIIFPLVLCIMPALLTVVVGPAVVTLIRTLGTP
jgi:tight adherence protein C